MPIAFLLGLIAIYARAPRLTVSARMQIPILPVACLMVGLLVRYSGLDKVSWVELLAPRRLVPFVLVAAGLFLFVIPYRMGSLSGAEILPVSFLSRYGWGPDLFAQGTLLPAAVLIAVSCLALVISQPHVRVVALVLACLMFFGLGAELSRSGLSKRWSAQTGALQAYPWRTFVQELEARQSQKIALSTDLLWRYKMSAATRTALARLVLRRRDVQVELATDVPAGADAAIVSRHVYRSWLREVPALAASAIPDPSGLLFLVFPKQSIERGSGGP